MISHLNSAALVGIDAKIVRVEVDIRRGLNKMHIVGLPDKAISEAKERIISAIKNSKCEFPKGIITVNLAPADLPKAGSLFDLPIALGILAASNQIKIENPDYIFIGELSLDGTIGKVNGVLSILASFVMSGKQKKSFFIPDENKFETSVLKDTVVYPTHSLNQILSHFNNNLKLVPYSSDQKFNLNFKHDYDLKNIVGQEHGKRALEIAAAGGHNILLNGVPGSGKTYISRCMPGIMPKMSQQEMIDVTRIYSVAGLLTSEKPLILSRPFRSPHTTSSQVSLIGGGNIPRPGEVSLSHQGVLFLDEFTEFPQKVLDSLRQPMEDRVVNISRAAGTLSYPANFTLLAAMNPCKCGFLGDPDRECNCSTLERQKYQRRISGPIMDRIDLQVKIPKVKISKLVKTKISESNDEVRERVEKCREIQIERFQESKTNLNSEMNFEEIKEYIKLSKSSLNLLKTAIESLNLSARSYFKILKLARTIADLEQSIGVKEDHISEALSYRF